jgi:hypothetical protein
VGTPSRILETLRQWIQSIGPYLVVEIVMPGGTLIALLMFLHRRGTLAKLVEFLPVAALAPFRRS